ncbi:hypothetical protein [Streptomyces sp. NPDC007205]|uniref:hypothetical protein n=1 Tax=Streptomyces sp. NPDC007205 TaxID=3154316 RepID=UPI0033F4AD66
MAVESPFGTTVSMTLAMGGTRRRHRRSEARRPYESYDSSASGGPARSRRMRAGIPGRPGLRPR